MSLESLEPFGRTPSFGHGEEIRKTVQGLLAARRGFGADDSRHWSYVAGRRGVERSTQEPGDDRWVGTRFTTPRIKCRDGIVIEACALTILDETVQFPPDSPMPVAAVDLRAYLHGDQDPECAGDPDAVLWATYEISAAPSSSGQKDDKKGFGLTVALEITPPTDESSYPLPDGIEEVWRELRLGSLTPCPDEGPMGHVAFDGRGEHVIALTRFIIDLSSAP